MLEPLRMRIKTVYLSEKPAVIIPKASTCPYREKEAVRTSCFSEIQTAIDAREHEKSHKVRAARIELASQPWQGRVLPLNHARNNFHCTMLRGRVELPRDFSH